MTDKSPKNKPFIFLFFHLWGFLKDVDIYIYTYTVRTVGHIQYINVCEIKKKYQFPSTLGKSVLLNMTRFL